MTAAVLQKWLAWCFLATGVLVGFFWYLGYFGGPVFTTYVPERKLRSDVAAVVLSGDMGLKVGMGSTIAEALNDDGIPVIGVNSLTFFRVHRNPTEVEHLVERAGAQALALNHSKRLILVGQSFGADMLHVGLARAPRAFRAQVRLVGLIVPTATVEFKASPAEILAISHPEGRALTTAKRLTWVPTLCLFGQEEVESLCPLLRQTNIWHVSLPGGHTLHYDSDAIIAALRAAIDASVPT